jgi:diguanylate cyclase (GGDEF)-like protein
MRIGRKRVLDTSGRAVRVRPLLLLLVMAGFLLIVAVTASGQVFLTTTDESTTLLNSAVGGDAAAVRSFVAMNLQLSDVAPGTLAPARATLLNAGIAALTTDDDILAAALLRPDGTLIASSVPGASTSAPITASLSAAVTSQQVEAQMLPAGESQPLAPLVKATVIREYLPIIDSGTVRAVAVVWRDATPILVQLDAIRTHTLLVIFGGAVASAVLVYIVFRGAQARMTRQTRDLLEAARRDPLTGTLNHGALVESLARRIELARVDPALGTVGIALVDIDNFSLLNDTYGHDAGDTALQTLADLLDVHVPDEADVGRYGPDEFLVTVPAAGIAGLDRSIRTIRDALVDVSLRFDSSERLPLTVSAGIATFPANGEAVTALLATVSRTLDEAKASGGDTIRMADASLPADEAIRFDVIESLVIAVDTKDHYTARHSEDVARYADFIAAELGLEDSFRHALRRAGRLHDVGKIGIPDGVLRKPGKLTAEEYEIVKQHVALGDQIVRDLPDIDVIRAGIRHHHERWDGNGYLSRLAGEEIPFVARILGVADAFSAMTTTRPYRKALSVDEAIHRLEDAAGSQLDERLVLAFVNGLRSAADPPLPGQDRRAATKAGELWVPSSTETRVA